MLKADRDMAASIEWKQRFRCWLANKLARLARHIYPQSEEVMAFWADRMTEMVITGQSFIKVEALDPEDVKIIHGKAWNLYQ